MPPDPAPPSRFPPEASLILVLLTTALAVVFLVLLADSESRHAQAARSAQVRALAADRALLELQLATRGAQPSHGGNAAAMRAFENARNLLDGDPRTLALVERIRPIAAAPQSADAGAIAALEELRNTLTTSSAAAAEEARQDVVTAHRVTLAAGLLLTLVTLGTVVFIFEERRRRRRLAQKLEREANHDLLTSLPNRRFFLEWLSYALAQARRDGRKIALLYIDLDGFKTVNDRHGHRRGDAALAAIAERLRSTKREGDLLARIGGDEFALAAPNARDGHEMAALGERLLASLTDGQAPQLSDVPLGASIGIAFYPDDANDVPGLLAAADAAMYAAKRAGGHRVAFHVFSEA
ncbi:MAG TPA: GGDEF domain-containing protein [Casimicrobiaceae bacterium]|nr:GGDEF domain-containing protein [Casimicrobiaceae bacterium]